jgi:thiol:disulfide interchange protein
MVTLRNRFQFWPSILFIAVILLFFWVRGVWRVSQFPERYQRLPSSYDKQAQVPVQQRINAAKAPYILMDFYQDACMNCRQVAPVLAAWKTVSAHQRCFEVIPVNTDTPENRFFVDIFQVDEIPALYVFEPQRMKKTPVPDMDSPIKVTVDLSLRIRQGLKNHVHQSNQALSPLCNDFIKTP